MYVTKDFFHVFMENITSPSFQLPLQASTTYRGDPGVLVTATARHTFIGCKEYFILEIGHWKVNKLKSFFKHLSGEYSCLFLTFSYSFIFEKAINKVLRITVFRYLICGLVLNNKVFSPASNNSISLWSSTLDVSLYSRGSYNNNNNIILYTTKLTLFN